MNRNNLNLRNLNSTQLKRYTDGVTDAHVFGFSVMGLLSVLSLWTFNTVPTYNSLTMIIIIALIHSCFTTQETKTLYVIGRSTAYMGYIAFMLPIIALIEIIAPNIQIQGFSLYIGTWFAWIIVQRTVLCLYLKRSA